MKPNNRLYFKRVLSDLLQLTRVREGNIIPINAEWEDRQGDFLDRASAHMESTYKNLIRQRSVIFIHRIEQALSRIENGSFGICDECGEEIPVDRLKALPDTAYCVGCKMEIERRERVEQSMAG
ncbi:MAG: TraR/DksA family transcriptional regulator [Thermodesulfobacteriota bacterium]